ncbi:MAG TPA: hypothetical protein PKN96_01125 [Flavobacterium sp.]|uniref:hypothetical protein n=1 Tax=Flavobacterium sp. TaxID=239 RepID=UPI002BDD6C70|nr:hypothetical protein [Flavobacterium sp.]HNP31873.1 hypothetical protein [Flavobacterium sp.]
MYNYSKFTQYAYLFAAILFGIDGFNEFEHGNKEGAYVRFGLAALGVFMFFFRRSFARKLQERNKKT